MQGSRRLAFRAWVRTFFKNLRDESGRVGSGRVGSGSNITGYPDPTRTRPVRSDSTHEKSLCLYPSLRQTYTYFVRDHEGPKYVMQARKTWASTKSSISQQAEVGIVANMNNFYIYFYKIQSRTTHNTQPHQHAHATRSHTLWEHFQAYHVLHELCLVKHYFKHAPFNPPAIEQENDKNMHQYLYETNKCSPTSPPHTPPSAVQTSSDLEPNSPAAPLRACTSTTTEAVPIRAPVYANNMRRISGHGEAKVSPKGLAPVYAKSMRRISGHGEAKVSPKGLTPVCAKSMRRISGHGEAKVSPKGLAPVYAESTRRISGPARQNSVQKVWFDFSCRTMAALFRYFTCKMPSFFDQDDWPQPYATTAIKKQTKDKVEKKKENKGGVGGDSIDPLHAFVRIYLCAVETVEGKQKAVRNNQLHLTRATL